MFNWLKTKVREMRMAMAFPAFETAARSAHIAATQQRHRTVDIEREIGCRMKGTR